MQQLLKYLKPYLKYVILAPILMLIEVSLELLIPKLMTNIINVGVPARDISYILQVGGLMLLLSAIGITGGIGCLVFASKASQNFGADVRQAAFEKIQQFSFANIDKFQTSSLITRLTNDITQIQMLVLMSLRMLVRAPLLFVGGMIMAASINAKMTVLFLVLIPILVLVMGLIIKFTFPLFNLVQTKLDKVNTVMRENLSGVRVVKAFVRSDHEKEKFKKANLDYRDTTIKAFRLMVLLMPAMMLIMNLATIAILWFGGLQVQAGTMLIGDIMAFITYLTQILMALMMIAMVLMFVSRSKVSADRLNEVLETEVDIHNPDTPCTTPITRGKVEYRNVVFQYASGTGEPVLDGVSFCVNPGETVGILGMTGSGKSTLVNLMPRLYDVTDGAVLIDDVDVRDYRLEDLRHSVSMVLQEAILFSGTIRENIMWGKEDATEEEVVAAAKAAQAHDFILELPNQYETELGQKGVNLSGGQKQRISIARALLKKPKVLIFDDSTSAVDMVTEKKIQQAMREAHKDCTKFIIAQRISSVVNADKILVLSDGRIVAEGSHDELIKTSTDYQEIYHSQVGKGAMLDE